MKLFLMALAFIFSFSFALACPCKKVDGCPECGKVSVENEYKGKQITPKAYPCEKCAKGKDKKSEEKVKVE